MGSYRIQTYMRTMTMKGQCQVIGPRGKHSTSPPPPHHRTPIPHTHALHNFNYSNIYQWALFWRWGRGIFSEVLRINFKIVCIQQQQKQGWLIWWIFYSIYQYYFNINKKAMKISSPFVEYIPECKRNMRRLRKKIYKFITSRNYTRKQNAPSDLMNILVAEQLNKRKSTDLSAIKNLNVTVRMTLKEVAAITATQERQVSQLQQEWLQNNRLKSKLKACLMEGLRDAYSKRTLSSTEFEYDQEQLDDHSSGLFAREESAGVQNLNQDIEFHHFQRGNSFLQIESSILSQENLFKFQQ